VTEPDPRPTWLASDRLLARSLGRPVARFLHVEAAGGLVLLAATVAALLWANSPWSASYEAFWGTTLTIDLGGRVLVEDLRHWVNDGLMTLFFFVVGLEIKRELVAGQLSSVREAALPALAALGGMVVPAVLYAAVNAGGAGADGGGIPMATDIAFAVGVLAVVGSHVPPGLRILLLGLAIVDDIGAILVIAVFYSEDVRPAWLAAAVAGLLAVVVLRRFGVRYTPVYVVVGAGVWLAMLESGVHATIAGVALALLTPARALLAEPDADRVAARLSADADVTAAEVREVSFEVRESVSVAERLQDLLHPYTSFLVIPAFALANAGVTIAGHTVADAVRSPVALGIVVGLVAGKLIGVAGAVALAVRYGGIRLPAGVAARHVIGMAGLAGIGFTVSLFVTGLAFDDPALVDQAKLGVLTASVLAAGIGSLVLRSAPARHPRLRADGGLRSGR
jgi:NhaA family Na+:H+ antiporter